MRPIIPNPRGMALVMAMIVVTLITVLVAGAISFTGTERAAAEVQSQESSMSACIQAARNLFLSQLEMVPRIHIEGEGANAVPFLDISFDEDLHGTELRTGHLGQVASLSARRSEAMADPMRLQGDDTGRPRGNTGPQFYTVTAVCRDTLAPGAPEREIEFMVRVGI